MYIVGISLATASVSSCLSNKNCAVLLVQPVRKPVWLPNSRCMHTVFTAIHLGALFAAVPWRLHAGQAWCDVEVAQSCLASDNHKEMLCDACYRMAVM